MTKSFLICKRITGYSICIFSLFLFFQNCSQVQFKDLDTRSLSSESNGGTYAGKLDGLYSRYTPDFTCENRSAPTSSVEFSLGQIQLTENKQLLCGAVKKELDYSLIDFSIYQKEVIGYQEGIFDYSETQFTAIPANLVEVWCKDRNDEQGIETLTHYDRVKMQAVNRIYYSSRAVDGSYAPKKISDFSVARVIGPKEVIIKDEKGFELHVYRDQLATQVGLFKGRLSTVIDGKNISRETACRLGGSLDPHIWPVKRIVDFNVTGYKTSPDLTSLAYTSDTVTGVPFLYSALTNGRNHHQVSPNIGTRDFAFSNNSQSLIYRGGGIDGTVNSELLKSTLDGTLNVNLGSRILGNKYFIDKNSFISTIDDRYLIFPEYVENRIDLKIAANDGSSILVAPQTESPLSLVDFTLSNSRKKVVYLAKHETSFYNLDTRTFIYSVNFDGSNLTDITPENSLPWQFTEFLGVGKYVLAKASISSGYHTQSQYKLYLISLEGSGSKALPTDYTNPVISSDSSGIFIITGSTKLQHVTYDTGISFELPSLQYEFVSGNDRLYTIDPSQEKGLFISSNGSIVGKEILANGKKQAVQVSAISGVKTLLCPNQFADQMRISELEQNEFLIIAYDKTTQILNVFLKSIDSYCRKINSLPIGDATLSSHVVSQDRQKILVKSYSSKITNATANTTSQLFYIPLNGTLPMIVNSPVNPNALIYDTAFSLDSRSVIFVGDQIVPSVQNVFLWTVPETK